MRDFDKKPYSPDEERVAKFFFDKGTGGGDDPIGSMMAGYEFAIFQRNELIKQNQNIIETIRGILTVSPKGIAWVKSFIEGFKDEGE